MKKCRMKDKNFVWLLTCIASLTVGLWLGNRFAEERSVEIADIRENALVQDWSLFECVAWRCPASSSIEVDGNYETYETLVYIPISLTKGAGRFVILRKREVIFETPALAALDIQIPEDKEDQVNDTFTLTYWESWENLENPVKSEAVFRFQDGRFQQISGDPLLD